MKQTAIIIFFLLYSTVAIWAQKFIASVDKNNVALGDVVHLSFKLLNATGSNFTPPAFNGARILSGPEMSNEITFNGSVRSMVEAYSYDLQVTQKGKIIIGPATIFVRGNPLHTYPVAITVNNTNKSNGATTSGENIFLRAVPNKTVAILGEAISVSYKLYVAGNVNMASPTITKLPTFTGFWAETVKLPPHSPQTEETYKGKRYAVFVIHKLILFPQKTGQLTVDPFEIECTGQMEVQAHINPYDPLSTIDNLFGNNVVPFHKAITSDALKMNILPLPEKNKPASFSGMVGQAAISAYADHSTVKANEPVIYRLTVGGEGNLSLQQPLKLKLPPDIEVYDPKTIDKLDKSGDNLTGTRTFEYTLMPHSTGKFEIPAVSFSYFDPVKKAYFESKTNPIALTVEKNDKPLSSNDSNVSGTKKDKEALPDYIKWSILVSSCLVLFFAVLLIVKRKQKQPVDLQKDEIPFALEDYNIYLDRASKLALLDERNQFYTVMLNALYSFMELYLQIPFADLSRDSIKKSLEGKNISSEIISNYLRIIDECEMIKFAPAGYTGNKEHILTRGKQAIEMVLGNGY